MIKLKDLLSEGKLTEAKGKWAVINANDVLNIFAEKVVDTQKEAEKIAKQMKQKDKYGKYQAVSVKRWNQAKPGNKIKEGKLTEKKQLYVVASTNGTLFSGDKGVTEKQALKIMDRYEKVGMNLFMLGVQYWNKPHKYNKKKIMVGEGKLTNEAIDLKDAGGEIFDTIIAFKKIYEKSPYKKNRKINMYIKQLLKIEQQISDVIGDLD